ncbi:MAG TPA: hypothetical protein VIJ59_00655 [Caulobacteraceae bacterium]
MNLQTERRRELAESAGELTSHCVESFEAGGNLAETIARGLKDWGVLLDRLSLGRRLDPSRAGVIILEAVFDELLEPVAWRVLADIFALSAP